MGCGIAGLRKDISRFFHCFLQGGVILYKYLLFNTLALIREALISSHTSIIAVFLTSWHSKRSKLNQMRQMVPAVFTIGNLIGGILAIVCTFGGRIDLAPYCIFASAILDFFDGFVARLLKVDGEFGKQLDSLADMVTFGLAPGLMMMQLMKLGFWFKTAPDLDINGESLRALSNINGMCEQSGWAIDPSSLCFEKMYHYFPFVAFLIPVFAMIRLAKFNIDKRQSNAFRGLPTPAMTLIVTSIPLMIMFQNYAWQGAFLSALMNPFLLAGISLVLALLMVLPVKLFALKFKQFGWKGNEIRFVFLIGSAVLLATLVFWALPVIVLFYILLSVVQPKSAE